MADSIWKYSVNLSYSLNKLTSTQNDCIYKLYRPPLNQIILYLLNLIVQKRRLEVLQRHHAQSSLFSHPLLSPCVALHLFSLSNFICFQSIVTCTDWIPFLCVCRNKTMLSFLNFSHNTLTFIIRLIFVLRKKWVTWISFVKHRLNKNRFPSQTCAV